jgi:hypothetical protein
MSILKLRTNLKSLKYTDFGGKNPYVIKDINDSSKWINQAQQENYPEIRRGEDKTRILAKLTDTPIFEQRLKSLLQAQNQKTSDGSRYLKKEEFVTAILANIINSVGWAGTGTYESVNFLQDITYLPTAAGTSENFANSELVQTSPNGQVSPKNTSELGLSRLPKPAGNEGVSLQLKARKRIDDVQRLTNFFKTGSGLAFVGNIGALKLLENQNREGNALQRLGRTALSTANVLASILAQTAVSGTGVHLSANYFSTYLKPVFSVTGFGGLSFGKERKGLILDNEIDLTQKKPKGVFTEDDEKKKFKLRSEKSASTLRNFTDNYFQEKGKDYKTSETSIIEVQRKGPITDGLAGREFIPVSDPRKGRPTYLNYKGQDIEDLIQGHAFSNDTQRIPKNIEESDKLEIRTKFSQSGSRGYIDTLNGLTFLSKPLPEQTSDLIDFNIQIYEPGNSTPFYMYFRAYLESLDDSYSGKWNSTNYIGRAESLYNYTGFDRTINFNFKAAASSKQEMKGMYDKLNYLAGSTAPSYSTTFMRGVFTKLTIGDYFRELPGFCNSVGLSWNTSYPWEIDYKIDQADKDLPSLPHILDVKVSYTPIHTKTPQFKDSFIGRQTPAAEISPLEQDNKPTPDLINSNSLQNTETSPLPFPVNNVIPRVNNLRNFGGL